MKTTNQKLKELLEGENEAVFSYDIETLEKLGWEFQPNYNDVAQAQEISDDEAKKFMHDNYYVQIKIRESGETVYFLCMEPHYGNERHEQGETGDDEATINDVYKLEKK